MPTGSFFLSHPQGSGPQTPFLSAVRTFLAAPPLFPLPHQPVPLKDMLKTCHLLPYISRFGGLEEGSKNLRLHLQCLFRISLWVMVAESGLSFSVNMICARQGTKQWGDEMNESWRRQTQTQLIIINYNILSYIQ